MEESRSALFLRGLGGRCPRCSSKDLFQTHYRLRNCCPECGLPLEQEDGWGLGAIPLNYGFTCLFWILPIGLAYLTGLFSLKMALILAGIGAVAIPFLTFRRAKCLWIGIYYSVLPHETASSGQNKRAPD